VVGWVSVVGRADLSEELGEVRPAQFGRRREPVRSLRLSGLEVYSSGRPGSRQNHKM